MIKSQLTRWGSLLVCCLCFVLHGFGQGRSIHGTVKAANDNAALPGATVSLASDRKVATSTDAAGNFSLNIPAARATGPLRLLISSVGYQTRELDVDPHQTEL